MKTKKPLNIAIMGMGYVGSVCGACFASMGHRVVGIDINKEKIKILTQGKSPIVEPGLGAAIQKSVKKKLLTATSNPSEGLKNADVILVSVGTPSQSSGNLDYAILERTCEDIGLHLRYADSSPIVIIRSTVLSGFLREVAIPTLEKVSGKKNGKDFFLCVNPEFLREGSAIKDFYNPPFILLGIDKDQKKTVEPILRRLYKDVSAPIVVSTLEAAETIKYACNAFHAVKISFANEVGRLCQKVGADSEEVMKLFCLDNKLNISPAYLKPGFAFGGSCLPKDLRAINYLGKTQDVELPLFNSLLLSNEKHIQSALDLILKFKKRKIGMIGLSFKPDTDDLRESPLVVLAESLIGKGMALKILDPNVSLAKLRGANKSYITNQIPHISKLLTKNIKETISGKEIVIIGTSRVNWKSFKQVIKKTQILIDLGSYVPKSLRSDKYHSIV